MDRIPIHRPDAPHLRAQRQWRTDRGPRAPVAGRQSHADRQYGSRQPRPRSRRACDPHRSACAGEHGPRGSRADFRGSPGHAPRRRPVRLLRHRRSWFISMLPAENRRRSANRGSTTLVRPSPDQTHVLVGWLHRPYSYQLTAGCVSARNRSLGSQRQSRIQSRESSSGRSRSTRGRSHRPPLLSVAAG